MRFNEDQFNFLALKAKESAVRRGYLYKSTGKKQSLEIQTDRLQKRWYALHYNLLFYYENQWSSKALGVILIEKSLCRRLPDTTVNGFILGAENEDQRPLIFVASSEDDCNEWVEAFNESSGEGLRARNAEYINKIKELEAHLARERQAKERLQRECADQWSQVARLKAEVSGLRDKRSLNPRNSGRSSDSSRDSTSSGFASPSASATLSDEEITEQFTADELKKITKLQCFLRGWLVRKRFLRLVNVYVTSAEGEQLMKRNRILMQFIISEEDYVQQLTTLVKVFHTPFSMAADSKYQACSREEVKSMFANSDTILILHQMFLEGVKQRLKYWPDMHLDDYLSAMVSMLPVYHEYIRNHTNALNTLSQCKKRPKFTKLLSWYESKSECNGQTIEQFLHYPVALLPTYARILRELLEATPSNDPEKVRLQEILEKLESLHNSLNIELSESESIKQTLEIERMIYGGCEVLLDADQKFIRTGLLRHYVRSKMTLGIAREKMRHCFLFSRYLIITSRTSDGCLRLAKICGKIPLKYATLVEDVDDEHVPVKDRHLAFTLQVQSKIVCFDVTLMATRPTDKAIWTSDISQCIYSLTLEDPEEEDDEYGYEKETKADDVDKIDASNSVSSPVLPNTSLSFRTASIKDDPRLRKDAEDIKYTERIGPNNLPQILYASLDRLVERLVDPRLPGTDFTDTFLVTYRYFATGKFVLQALINFYHQLEDERNGKQPTEVVNDDRDGGGAVKRKTSLGRSLSYQGSRDRSSSTMSTSSSMSSFDDHDSLSPLLPSDALSFATWNRRHSRTQWYDNPPAEDEEKLEKPRSMSQNNGSVSNKEEDDRPSRRKTSPASFLNVGNTLRKGDTGLTAVQNDLETSEPTKTRLERTESDYSVNSLCSDEVYDQQLETLLEAASEDVKVVNGNGEISEASKVTDEDERICQNLKLVNGNDGMSKETKDVNGNLDVDKDAKVVNGDDGTSGQTEVFKENEEIESCIEQNLEADTEDCHVGAAIDEQPRERGIDVEDPTQLDEIDELHVDWKQRMLVRKHMYEHRPSLPTLLPRGKQGKDLAKWFGVTDESNLGANHNKKRTKKDKIKDKERETKMSRSPSSSSSNGSQNDDRNSFVFVEDDGSEKPPTPQSVKKSLRSAISSPFPRGRSKNGPESPKKKISIFSKSPKSSKSMGMKRSKSDYIHTGAHSSQQDALQLSRSLGNKSFLGDEDMGSVGSYLLIGDSGMKQSISDGNLKEKASPKPKKGKHVTLKIDTGKKRANSHDISLARDESRVSMRAILPNRAPLKILNIMKHWVSKHHQDFKKDAELLQILRDFFEDVKKNPDTLPVVKEIVKSMERLMETNRQSISNFIEDIFVREATNQVNLPEQFPATWSPIKIADNLTLLEHHLYGKISTRELMKCAWTKKDKEEQAPFITKISRRFNQVSGMVAYEVIHGTSTDERSTRIEFWIAVAARCRDLNNFNSVLQITSGLMKSSVYRLKKSWELVNKQLKGILNDLQTLVSADNCFGKLREAIHNCNPPCVPFIGFYLTDLLFTDERSPNTNEAGLINYAKMTKISRAIREIRQYQQLRYTLDFDEDMAQYLLASHVETDIEDFEDVLYEQSLQAEPRG